MGKGGRQLKVVTLNIFSANAGMDVPRIKRQIALLRAHDPDVICLQEAWEDEVVGFFSAAFPHHRVAKASATGLRRTPPAIAYLSSAVAALLCAAFALLPSVAAAGSSTTNPAGWLGVLVCAMLALAWFTFPLLTWLPILSPLAIWGLEAGCSVVSTFYGSLAVIFAPPIFLWWLGWSGVAPIAGAIQHGDPFGLLVLVRRDDDDDAGTAEAGAGVGARAAAGAAGAAAAAAEPVLVEAMAYEQQGYIFDGGPWLFWAGWFEATFLYRGAVAIECTLAGAGGAGGAAGRRVRIVNTHLANGVHNRHRMAQVKELATFCKPRAAAKRREVEESKAAAGGAGSSGGAGAGAGGGGDGGGGGAGGHRCAVWSSTADAAGGAGYVQPSATFVCCDSNGDSSEPEMRWLRKSCLSDSFLCHWAKGQPGDGGGGGGGGGRGGKEGDDEELRDDTPHGGLTWDNANALTHGNLVEPDQRIDFVFLAKGSAGRVVDSAIIGDNPPLSDHYAVMSTFEMDG